MTNYILFEVDDIEVNKSRDGMCINFEKDHSRASIYLTKKQLKTLIDYAQAELQDSELVEEGVEINGKI